MPCTISISDRTERCFTGHFKGPRVAKKLARLVYLRIFHWQLGTLR